MQVFEHKIAKIVIFCGNSNLSKITCGRTKPGAGIREKRIKKINKNFLDFFHNIFIFYMTMGAQFAGLCIPIRTCVTYLYTYSRHKITTIFANKQINEQKNANFVYFLREKVDFYKKENKQPAICGLFS